MNFYVCKPDMMEYLNDEDVNFLRRLSNLAERHHAANIHDRVGYEVIGPALLGYTVWLHNEVERLGADTIVFLSREGKILQRAYEQSFPNGNIRTIYINVSRIALQRASMVYAKNLDDVLGLLTYSHVKGTTKIRELFDLLMLGEHAHEYSGSDLRIYDIDEEDKRALYDFIMSRGMTYFYNQNILVKKYLADKGITGGRIIVSDIGYTGTMQQLLSNITRSVNYAGCYVIAEANNRYKYNLTFRQPEIYGYWTKDEEAYKIALRYFWNTTAKFESLFLSTEGTTTKYVEITEGGGVYAITEEGRADGEPAKMISLTHDSALHFLKDSPFSTNEILCINPNVFFTPIMNLISSFDNDVSAFYNGIRFMNRPFLPAKSRLYYFTHPLRTRIEMGNAADIRLWMRGLLGRLSTVYFSARSAVSTLRRWKHEAKLRCVYYVSARRIGKAYDAASMYDIISFDVFDTLIFRRCQPRQVFDAAEKIYNSSHDDKVKDFMKQRIKASQFVAQYKAVTQETTLDEIYDELSYDYSRKFADDMKAAEIQAEFESVYPNDEMLSFYQSMKAAGKRIIIASDMYLPGSVIAGLLKKCGCDGYESLYVSSDYRARKSTGSLFRRIVRDKGVNPSEIMHIGDNAHSDYIMAGREGLRGFLYKPAHVVCR